MTNPLTMNRRQFVVATALVGGGLAVGLRPASAQFKLNREPFKAPPSAPTNGVDVTPWMMIMPDNTIVMRVAKAEMGNGALTAMPMMICEELECDWSKIQVEYADPNRSVRENNAYKSFGTFGSLSVRTSREYLQQAGAAAREMLKTAAAQQWNVPIGEIDAKNSILTHRPTGRTLTFGDVSTKAAAVKLAAEPKIKTPDQYTLMGKAIVKRFDTPVKVNGSAVFGMDVQVPNMATAAIRHSPVAGGKLKSFDFEAIKSRPGVIAASAVRVPGVREAVAVVADSYWNAKSALDVMPIEWDDGAGANFESGAVMKTALELLDQPGAVSRTEGNVDAALRSATKVVEAVYQTPYLEHATMEPLNATAEVKADRVDVWLGTQDAGSATTASAQFAGLRPDQVYVHNLFLGGGFGRRTGPEVALEAISLAKTVNRPVKVVWSREETTRQGAYRPLAVTKFRAGLGPDGMPVAMHIRTVSDSLMAKVNPNGFRQANDVDSTAVLWLKDAPYAIPNFQLEYKNSPTHLVIGFLRAPGTNQTVYMYESFLDELAAAAGKDEVAYRRTLLRDAKDPGFLKVLNEITDKSEWGKKTFPKGTAQGVGICEAHGSISGCVAEVSVTQDGSIQITKVDLAYDSGNIVNKSDVEAQAQSAVVYAQTALMYGEINFRKGRVVEGNFDDYQMMRIAEMPNVVTHHGALTGGTKWGGIGEIGVPPLFSAVTSAIFKITGKRIRSLPLKNHDLTWS